MKDFIKSIAFPILNALKIDLTLNQKYDRLTKTIIKKVVKAESICIDVGCHKGEILEEILKYSNKKKHFAFEPIPHLFKNLEVKFKNVSNVYPYALSDKTGNTKFHIVKNDPAYSGILKRRYDIKNPDIEEIDVEMRTLDDVIPSSVKIDLIKIDAEGAEFPILKGGINTLLKNKPIVIFECGLGASNYYGTQPQDIYDYLILEIGLKLSLLEPWLKMGKPLTKEEFCEIYNKGIEYYFIASKN